MPNRKTALLISFVALVAFAAGYRKSTISASVNDVFAYFDDKPESEPRKAQSAAPDVDMPDPRITAPKPQPQPPARNPYEEFLKQQHAEGANSATPSGHWESARNNPFGGTLDSIQQKKIQDHQTAQRNLYFEKLSEQMKAMRGEVPTAPTARRGTVVDETEPASEDSEDLAAEVAEPEPYGEEDGAPAAPVQNIIEDSGQVVVFDPEGEMAAEEERIAAEEEALLSILQEMNE